MLVYDETIECGALHLPLVASVMPPRVERPLRSGRYLRAEWAGLQSLLHPKDRLLVLGAGFGLIPTLAARLPQIGAIIVVEQDQHSHDIIAETLRLNEVNNVDLRLVDRLDPGLAAILAETRPDVIYSALDGAELDLLETADLSAIRAMLLKTRAKSYGATGEARLLGALAAGGLIAGAADAGSAIYALKRDLPRHSPGLPPRSFRDWPITAPRVHIATCMKDEGPFILEWLAWHRALGVTDITVFTNDCSDGTDLILDRLAELGWVQHLPNPALLTQATAFQPIALAYAAHLPATRTADFFLSMDVDEFLNIRVGDRSLSALFAASGAFDVLSISEVNHGANGHENYQPGWLTEMFPAHQTTSPGKPRARRGVKSILRLSERVQKLRNHRPDLRQDLGPILWRDGSGRPTAHFHADGSENGHDARGSFDLVRLEHFPLRSLDSYLAKMFRGDVVVAGKSVSRTYWRSRNRQEENSADLGPMIARAKAWFDQNLAQDTALMALHQAACAAHAARIATLLHEPVFAERRAWILQEAWTTTAANEEEAAED